jgi:pyruvate,water dikinase
MTDVESVGGKNASLGEMISQLPQGVRVPTGFATTAHAFREFLAHEGLADKISAKLAAWTWTTSAPWPGRRRDPRHGREPALPGRSGAGHPRGIRALQGGNEAPFAVRSSATAEDLPDASFAGQQETFLNVVGIDDVLHKMKEVFASLYNDRAISYRVHKGFAHDVVALSAGVQRMVRSDLGAAGVMFTIDTESGFEDVVFITSSYGLGETVVQGAVNPDEFYVHKPMLKAGKKAVIRRNLGSKLIQMVFATPEKAASGKLVKTTDVPRAAQPLLADRRRRAATGPLRAGDRAALRPPHGHRVGQGRHRRPALHPAGPPETVKSQAKGQAELRYKLKGTAPCWPKAAPSARRSAPARCAWCTTSPRWTRCSPATCW